MIGAWTCLVRFACHIPMGVVAFTGRSIYDTVKVLDEGGIFDVIPNGHTFLSGLQMYSTWGVFAFSWNFVTFIACWGAVSWLLFLLAAVDLLVACSLMGSVIKQAQFAPHTYSACEGAMHWRNGTDGRNFFLEAEWETWETYGLAESFCKTLVETWAYTIAMVALYGLMGIINMALFIVFEYMENKDRAKYGQGSRSKEIFSGIGGFLWGIILLASTLVLCVLEYPLAVFRFLVRYVGKKFGGWKHNRKYQKAVKRITKAPQSEYVLAKEFDVGDVRVLPPEVLLLIAREVHFSDLVSASRASKALRAGLFGTEDVPTVLRNLQTTTCHQQQKEGCKLCGIQICRGCREQNPVVSSVASWHMGRCRPHCTKCYFKATCRGWARKKQWAAKHKPTCFASRSEPDVEMAPVPAGGFQTKTLCRLCATLAAGECGGSFETRTAADRDRSWMPPIECCKCREGFWKGTVWWVCKDCGTECPSHLHPTRA